CITGAECIPRHLQAGRAAARPCPSIRCHFFPTSAPSEAGTTTAVRANQHVTNIPGPRRCATDPLRCRAAPTHLHPLDHALALVAQADPPTSRTQAELLSGMQGGPVDELLDVAIERPALDQLEVEVGRTLEDRGITGLTGDHREEGHLDA